MTQEEKQLLLKDLCARLPYGVICNTPLGSYKLIRIENDDIDGVLLDFLDFSNNVKSVPMQWYLSEIKPYLRPMLSMTEEEGKQYNILLTTGQYFKLVSYLNSIHMDYRGLIPMGLALEAPEGMYNLKIKKDEDI